jgi:Aminoglycoside adenylyltransferase, C-terminal domain
MMQHLLSPTPYREVNEFLDQLLTNQQTLLGKYFVGLYLGGSLALGAFNLYSSDIDFLTITSEPLPAEAISELERLHRQLHALPSKWGKKLDGSYVPQKVVRHWTASHPPCPFVEGDEFQVTNQGSAVIQRHIIREHGVTIVGPDPHELIDPVSEDEIWNALHDMAETWWRPELDNPSWIAQARNQPFAILTMCRTLYVLEHGDVASKVVAGRWAQKALGQPWFEPIEWALTWPRNPESDHTIATLQLVAFTLDRFSKIEKRQRLSKKG